MRQSRKIVGNIVGAYCDTVEGVVCDTVEGIVCDMVKDTVCHTVEDIVGVVYLNKTKKDTLADVHNN